LLRVTTLHASSAAATAAYYAKYLTAAPGEVPGTWSGRQADRFGLAGRVEQDELEALLSGRDPVSGTGLGRELVDRYTANGRVVRAVAGFDATFSAPKSLSVWWALTGDRRLLDAHDAAVTAALAHLERFGATTRIRAHGARLHPDTEGLTMGVFRQTTSRADDPQIHTHAVISAKVQTVDGRWWALDARYLKRHQRMLGGLYQSVLRAELTHRFGIGWGPVRHGQADIAGIPHELLEVFSKRSAVIDVALAAKLDEFRARHGQEPSRWERAAMCREASADTRARKSGHGAADLTARWRGEAARLGWTRHTLETSIDQAAAAEPVVPRVVTVGEVVAAVAEQRSAWSRADVVQAICDLQQPASQLSGDGWAAAVEAAADRVVGELVDLDPPGGTVRRASDGRSVWIEPTAAHFSTNGVLAQEEAIVTWAMAAQADPPTPSATLHPDRLDAMQAAAAKAVAGEDRLVLVVGPAGVGKTRMLAAARHDLHRHGRVVAGLAPTAKAARTLQRDTLIATGTVAKLLHEWLRPDRGPRPDYQYPAGTTLVVDEAGLITTPDLHQLICLADLRRWRVVLVGDPHQLQGVGRSGMFAELCATGRVEPLERLHRFTQSWEAAASLQLRRGDPRALDAYAAHGRIVAGRLDTHLHRLATTWITYQRAGRTVALVASTNEHVDTINRAVQAARLAAGHLAAENAAQIAGGEHAHVGDVVATRRNDRRLVTTGGQPVRNRDTWTVTALHGDGSLSVSHQNGHGDITLPVDYVHEHVRLGYAATEHGWQSDTVHTAIALTTPATTRRGLYVAATRGRDENVICVVTDSDDPAEARDTLEAVLATDRADTPAITQRRTLAQQRPPARNQPAGSRPSGREPARSGSARSGPVPRGWLPDWVLPALIDTRRRLAAAQAAEARDAMRAQLVADAAAAERALNEITAATEPARDAYHDAKVRSDQARADYVDALRRHGVARWPFRRLVQAEVDRTQRFLQRADHHLGATRQATAADRDAYHTALSEHQTARSRLDACDPAVRPDPQQPTVEDYQTRVAALTTWVRWAHGHDISDDEAAEAIMEVISDRRFPNGTLGIHPQAPQRPPARHPEREPATIQPLPAITPDRGFGLEL
jgi:conjugative relaxase-like TrwC/TraI family protein